MAGEVYLPDVAYTPWTPELTSEKRSVSVD